MDADGVGAGTITSQSTTTTTSSATLTARMSTTDLRHALVVVIGSTIPNIGAPRPTRTAQPQIDMEGQPAVIPSATVRRMRGRIRDNEIRANGVTGNETVRRIEDPEARNSPATEEEQAGNRGAAWIEAAEERIASVIDKFLIHRVDPTKALSAEPRRERAEAPPAPAASAALPAWEVREAAAHEVAAEAGEGRLGHDPRPRVRTDI